MSAKFKRPLTVKIEHDDLADLLTEALCGWTPFADMHCAFIEEKEGQYVITLAPKPKIAAALKQKEPAK